MLPAGVVVIKVVLSSSVHYIFSRFKFHLSKCCLFNVESTKASTYNIFRKLSANMQTEPCTGYIVQTLWHACRKHCIFLFHIYSRLKSLTLFFLGRRTPSDTLFRINQSNQISDFHFQAFFDLSGVKQRTWTKRCSGDFNLNFQNHSSFLCHVPKTTS